MVDSKLTALSELSVPALEDLAYLVDDPSGTPASYKATHARLGGLYVPGICEGRLTLSSGVPVTSTDITAASTIYFTPYQGDRVGLYDGTRWKEYVFTERSLALSGLTTDKNYDVFLYDNSGTLTLELSAAWTTNTTRADAVTTLNGIDVKSGSTTRRLVGTIRTTSTSTTEDSGGGTTTQVGGKRFVWNRGHRVPRALTVFDSTTSWTYLTNAWRQANAASGNQVEFVVGVVEDVITAQLQAGYQNVGASYAITGIGFDSTTAVVGAAGIAYGAAILYDTMLSQWNGYPSAAGYHALSWNENGLGSASGLTFVGPLSGSQISRLMATVLA